MSGRKGFLTLQEVAEKLGRNVRWVRKRIEEGSIKPHKFSARVMMVAEKDFDEYVRSCEPVTGN